MCAKSSCTRLLVSTLLEILGNVEQDLAHILTRLLVSTLLEILGLVCLVVVGF